MVFLVIDRGQGGGIAKIPPPPEIENFQNTPLSFEIFRRPPPQWPREAKPLFAGNSAILLAIFGNLRLIRPK